MSNLTYTMTNMGVITVLFHYYLFYHIDITLILLLGNVQLYGPIEKYGTGNL